MEPKLCPICESRQMILRGGMWWCWHCDDDTAGQVTVSSVIISRQVAWNCDCGEQNFTEPSAEQPVCHACGREYHWIDVADKAGTYEQTLDSDGNADFDAFVPDYPDTFIETEQPDYPEENEG